MVETEGATFNAIVAIISVLHLTIVVVDLFVITLSCDCDAREVQDFERSNITALADCAERLLDGTESCLSVIFASDFESVFILIDTGFLGIYVVELLLRLLSSGLRILAQPITILDVLIICSGLVLNLQYMLMDRSAGSSFPLLRLARVFRVFRVVNMLSFSPFKVLRRLGLSSGLLSSKLRLREMPDCSPQLMLHPSKRWHLFLSHHWNNQDVVATIKQQILLLTPGAKVFLDVDNLTALDRLEHEVEASQAMLVLLGSPAFFGSPNCLREVDAAVRHRVPLITVHDADEQKRGARLDTLEICCPSAVKVGGVALDDILFPTASGLVWKCTGEMRPCKGTLITHDKLSALLKQKLHVETQNGRHQDAIVEFTAKEWADLDVGELSFDHFIMSGGKYFMPTMPWRTEGGVMMTSPIRWHRMPALRERTLLLIIEQMLLASPVYVSQHQRTSVPLTILNEDELELDTPMQLRFSMHNNRTSGLKWHHSPVRPDRGVELVNAALAEALAKKTEFTHEEFDRFRVTGDIHADCYVESGGLFFQPVGGAKAVALELAQAISRLEVVDVAASTPSPSTSTSLLPSPFLLYLSSFTFKDVLKHDSDGHRLAEEVWSEWEGGAPIVLVHEQDPSVGGGDFSILQRTTPLKLQHAGLFNTLAIPWHSEPFRAVSIRLAAHSVGAKAPGFRRWPCVRALLESGEDSRPCGVAQQLRRSRGGRKLMGRTEIRNEITEYGRLRVAVNAIKAALAFLDYRRAEDRVRINVTGVRSARHVSAREELHGNEAI